MDMPSSSFGAFGAGQATGANLPTSGRASFGQASASSLSMRWSALHDAAAAVAAIAGIAAEPMTSALRAFPAQVRSHGGWRMELAEQGVSDLCAIMEPGLAALLAVKARGADARAPGIALWQEFVRTRDLLLELISGDSAGTRPAV